MATEHPTHSGMRVGVVVGALALLGAVPFSDSPDFSLDTTLLSFDLGFAESPDFPIDTFLGDRPLEFAESAAFALDTTGLNRVWGDSEPFALDVPPQTGTLAVSPSGDFESAGLQYGPFAPGSKTYTLRNIGDATIDWTVSKSVPWLNLSVTSGSLSRGASVDVTISIDQINAGFPLGPGEYSDTVAFLNSTNGLGNQVRDVVLTVHPVNPAPGQDTDRERVSLDHLWEWVENAGQFVHPGPKGVTIVPNQPTYLLTHGWDGSLNGTSCEDPAYAMSSVGCAIRETNPDANLLAWDWQQAANPNSECDVPDRFKGELAQAVIEALVKALLRGPQAALLGLVGDVGRTVVTILLDARRSGDRAGEEGNRLGKALANILDDPNRSLGSELHLIGKSHGGGVMGRVAKILAEKGHPATSLTTLDTPKKGCLRFLGCFVNSLKNVEPSSMPETATAVFYYPSVISGGFGEAVSGSAGNLTNLKLNPELAPVFDVFHPLDAKWIDHLWISGLDGGVCLSDDGWYPTGLRTPDIPQFDGATPASSLLDVPEFPSGCYAEGSGLFQFLTTGCDATAGVMGDDLVSVPGMSLLRYEPFQSATTWTGNLTQLVIETDPADATNRVILMQEQGDASFFRDIDWPQDATVITFDYLFREPRGGENLTVYVDNKIAYYDNAETTLAHDHLTTSGAIYVGNVAGRTGRLNFVLRTDQPDGGEFGGELVIDNIRVYGFLEHDADLDGDRDLFDFAAFQRCFGVSPVPDECWAFDVDGVDGVGLPDYAGDATEPPQFKGFEQFIGDANTGGPRVPPAP